MLRVWERSGVQIPAAAHKSLYIFLFEFKLSSLLVKVGRFKNRHYGTIKIYARKRHTI